MMITIRLVIGIFLYLLLIGCAKTPVYKSVFQSDDFILDGSDTDWPTRTYSDYELGMTYGLSNDRDNLYVNLRVNNPMTSRKILLGGLILYFDTLGKGNNQLSVDFPLAEDINSQLRKHRKLNPELSGNKRPSGMSINSVYLNEHFKYGLAKMRLNGFDGKSSATVQYNLDTQGPNAMIQIDSSENLYYEMRIPLSMIFADPDNYLTDTCKVFSYGFETGAIQQSAGNKNRGRTGMRPGGDKSPGGIRGGSRGGGQRGQQGSGMDQERMIQMQEITEPARILVKEVSLSMKKL